MLLCARGDRAMPRAVVGSTRQLEGDGAITTRSCSGAAHRPRFRDATTLVIAHRLDTIADGLHRRVRRGRASRECDASRAALLERKGVRTRKVWAEFLARLLPRAGCRTLTPNKTDVCAAGKRTLACLLIGTSVCRQPPPPIRTAQSYEVVTVKGSAAKAATA